jgi:hypothetical protein
MRFSAASLATFAMFSLTTWLGAKQSAEKKSPAKMSSTVTQQSTTGGSKRPLVLSGSVPLEGVKGRFDQPRSIFTLVMGRSSLDSITVVWGSLTLEAISCSAT